MSRPTVLLVDPHDNSRRALTRLLRESECFVLQARDGEHAFRILRGRLVQLVVGDPWACPAAAVARLREACARAGIPLLALTTLPRERAGDDGGYAAYLEKPAPAERVIAEIHRLLGPPAPGAPVPASQAGAVLAGSGSAG